LPVIIVILLLIIVALAYKLWFVPGNVGPAPVVSESSSLTELARSPLVHWDVNLSGTVKAVGDGTVTVGSFDAPADSVGNFVLKTADVPVFSLYVLPAAAPEDQVVMTIADFSGKNFKLGERRIETSQVKAGEEFYASIAISQKGDWTVQKIRVQPQDLLTK